MKVKNLTEFPDYFADTDGNIWREKNGKLKKIKSPNAPYSQFNLYKDKIPKSSRVHRIILETFIGPCPKGMEACHNNGIKSDNRLINLRWDTRKSNTKDKELHGVIPKGENHYLAKLNNKKVKFIKILHTEFKWSAQKIHNNFGKIWKVSRGAIERIIYYKNTWKDIS